MQQEVFAYKKELPYTHDPDAIREQTHKILSTIYK